MQLTCPNCGEQIPSENINIQQMTAVCPTCSTVFRFDPPEAKVKRRKVKQPARVTLRESGGQLSLSFRTNFRLDKNETFISTGILGLVFTFLTVASASGYLASDVPLVIALGFGLATLFLYYLVALTIYNSTHIDVNEETIQVSRKPLPDLRTQPRDINLSGIERIRYAETPVSIREGYDTPRYTVWVVMVDGRRKVIVSDVIDDYAVFIAQRLNEYLHLDAQLDVSRLIDDDEMLDEGQLADEFILGSELDSR